MEYVWLYISDTSFVNSLRISNGFPIHRDGSKEAFNTNVHCFGTSRRKRTSSGGVQHKHPLLWDKSKEAKFGGLQC